MPDVPQEILDWISAQSKRDQPQAPPPNQPSSAPPSHESRSFGGGGYQLEKEDANGNPYPWAEQKPAPPQQQAATPDLSRAVNDPILKQPQGQVVVGTPQVVDNTPQPPPVVNQSGQPRPATGGQVGIGIQDIKLDTDRQLAAADEEEAARANYADTVGQAQGARADEEKQLGRGAANEAQINADDARKKIAEIGQLVHDYSNEKIDKNQWWGEMNVGQKIGAVVGAMFAGLGGGPKMAMEYVNNLMDRNLARQQEAIKRHGAGIAEANNLLYGFLKNSSNEQEAFDKARAAMSEAALVEVNKAATVANGPIQIAQIEELKAALLQQRDMFLAKLGAGRGGVGVSPHGLEVDGKNVFTDPATGQAYVGHNPSDTVHIQNALTALKTLEDNVKIGGDMLKNRNQGFWGTIRDELPYSETLQKGDALDQENLANLAAISKLPVRNGKIDMLLRQSLPTFGSRYGGFEAKKIDETLRYIEAYRQSLIASSGIPADITAAGGQGKNAGKLTYYAQPMNPQSPQIHPEAKKPPATPSPGFQPDQ